MVSNKILKYSLIAVIAGYFQSDAQAQVFFEDFKSKEIDTTVWNIPNTKWGENIKVATHGGVVPDNVYIKKGKLVVRAHGEKYKGKVQGHGQNTRVGGVINTKEKFASGSFEVRAKICPHPGALSAFWTYYYENDDYNHEIDFEFPGRNQPPQYGAKDSDIDWGLMSNWRGVSDSLRRTADKYFGNQTDGKYHLYRFDWHTGSENEKPRVEWYFDNKLMHVSYEMVPNHASQFWVGIWFPGWIQKANFKKKYMYIDWVKITPFKQKNDVF